MPKPPNRHSATAWIAKADEDIDAASLCLGTGERMTNVAAFHTQQAAEKLLKAQRRAESHCWGGLDWGLEGLQGSSCELLSIADGTFR